MRIKKNKQAEGGPKRELKEYVEKQHIIVFVATLVWGIAAHGYMFFNKFSWHDDMSHFLDVGTTYHSGRWFLGVLGEGVQRYLGNVSVPWFYGLLSLLFLAAANVLLVELFRLKRAGICILLGGMMAVFPSWVSTYGYMFTVAYYAFAVFLAVLGIYLVCTLKKSWCGILLGAACVCLSLGIYQAYLPLAVTVLVIAFMDRVIREPERSFREHFWQGFSGVCAVLLGLIFYFVMNYIFLSVKHISLTDYKNINQMGQTNIRMMVKGIATAWKEFAIPPKGGGLDMYMQSVRPIYYAVLVLTVCFLAFHMVQLWKKDHVTAFFLLGGALCFPIGVNLLYLMGDIAAFHGIMLFAKVMVFILPLVLVERIEADMWNVKKYGVRLLCALLVFAGVFYTHFANVCYLQADCRQKEVISWMNVLVARIQSEEGYRKDLPIAYLNCDYRGSTIYPTTTLMKLPGVEIIPYDGSFSHWKIGLSRWCGFAHEELTDTSQIESLPEVQNMPAYPDAGSVRIINGVIVVKFNIS